MKSLRLFNFLLSVALFFLFLFFLPLSSYAESSEDEGKKDNKEVVKTGTIASSSRLGAKSKGAVETEVSDGSIPGDKPNVIQASVSTRGKGYCDVKVLNVSEENSYSVSFNVIGRDKKGAKVINQSFSASLSPKGQTVKQVECRDYSMEVLLRSAKKKE